MTRNVKARPRGRGLVIGRPPVFIIPVFATPAATGQDPVEAGNHRVRRHADVRAR